jgi:predicted RNA-binding Zn-ribbon protein involved in translation (DUF1610 family)
MVADERGVDSFAQVGRMAGMSTYPFKCDLCGGVTELAPTYGDFKCQHCGQVYVYDECHRIELSERQLQTLRDSRWIAVSERMPEHGDAIWVYDGKDVLMGEYSHVSGFQSYGASMDREGLNSETLHGVTHWMEIDEPEPPEVK